MWKPDFLRNKIIWCNVDVKDFQSLILFDFGEDLNRHVSVSRQTLSTLYYLPDIL